MRYRPVRWPLHGQGCSFPTAPSPTTSTATSRRGARATARRCSATHCSRPACAKAMTRSWTPGSARSRGSWAAATWSATIPASSPTRSWRAPTTSPAAGSTPTRASRTPRPRWEGWLRRTTLLWLPDSGRYGNKYLVEAIAVLELLRSGLESDEAGSILADRELSRRRAARLLTLRVPRMADRERFPVAGEQAFVLSDPTAGSPWPTTVSPWACTRGGWTCSRVRRPPLPSGPCARSPTAHGRSPRQTATSPTSVAPRSGGWSLALTAYGALSAAALAPRRRRAPAWRGARAVGRLETMHGTGPKGFFITPSLRPDYREPEASTATQRRSATAASRSPR